MQFRNGPGRSFAAIMAAIALWVVHAAPAAAQDSAMVAKAGGNTLLRLNTDAGFYATGTPGVGKIPKSGEGVRMMWFPGRWAFRAGRVWTYGATYWDSTRIGLGSVALGENSRATGENSFAANLATTAHGREAVALGFNGFASGARSLAINGVASGDGAVVIANLSSPGGGVSAQATGTHAVALGITTLASGPASIALGGNGTAEGTGAVAIGTQSGASGDYSVAFGRTARTAKKPGAVVFDDGCAVFSGDSVYASAANQFVARGCGGFAFYSSEDLLSGVQLAANDGGWLSVSDRNRKQNFVAVHGEDVLARLRAVPVTSWSYSTQEESIRHMGPVAQDFRAAFGLGKDSVTINMVDLDGVTMAGVKALDAHTLEQERLISQLRDELSTLTTRKAELKQRLERLEARLLERRK